MSLFDARCSKEIKKNVSELCRKSWSSGLAIRALFFWKVPVLKPADEIFRTFALFSDYLPTQFGRLPLIRSKSSSFIYRTLKLIVT